MGVVTTVVLGNTEQDQFDTDLALTARIKLSEVASLQGGYAVAYYNTATRSVGVLSVAVVRHDRAAGLARRPGGHRRMGRASGRTLPRASCSASRSRASRP